MRVGWHWIAGFFVAVAAHAAVLIAWQDSPGAASSGTQINRSTVVEVSFKTLSAAAPIALPPAVDDQTQQRQPRAQAAAPATANPPSKDSKKAPSRDQNAAASKAPDVVVSEFAKANSTPSLPPQPVPVAAAPAADSEPEKHRPETLAALGAAQRATDAAKASYYAIIRAHVAAARRYPRQAMVRNIQGKAVLSLHIANDGRIVDSTLSESSGHRLLDNATAKIVERMAPLPPIPAALGKRSLVVPVPIIYQLVERPL